MAILGSGETTPELPNWARRGRMRATLAGVFNALGFCSALPVFEDGVFQADVYIGSVDVLLEQE